MRSRGIFCSLDHRSQIGQIKVSHERFQLIIFCGFFYGVLQSEQTGINLDFWKIPLFDTFFI